MFSPLNLLEYTRSTRQHFPALDVQSDSCRSRISDFRRFCSFHLWNKDSSVCRVNLVAELDFELVLFGFIGRSTAWLVEHRPGDPLDLGSRSLQISTNEPLVD